MRRPWLRTLAGTLAGTLAAGILVACGTSTVPDDAEVTISGSLLLPDSSPAAGVTVGLLREPGALETLFELAVTMNSLGLLCLTQSVSICEDARTTTTDDRGRYAFTMTGADTKSTFGQPSTFLLSAQLPAGDGHVAGPGVQTRFEVERTTIDAPELTFWEPPEFAVEAGREWVSYAGAEHRAERPDYAVVVTDGDEMVWSQPGSPAGQIDARAVADLRGAMHVTAVAQHRSDGVEFQTSFTTQQVPVQGAAGPPPSRAASCAVADHAAAASGMDPCPLTDGRYADDLAQQSCPRPPAPETPGGADDTPEPCAANSWVSVDLGQFAPVGAAFGHGLRTGSEVVVETSRDGTDWTIHSTGAVTGYERFDLAPGTVARYVRLRVVDPSERIGELAELSVWP